MPLPENMPCKACAMYDVTPGVTCLLTVKSYRDSTAYPLTIGYNDYSDIGIIWTTKRSLEQKGLRSAG